MRGVVNDLDVNFMYFVDIFDDFLCVVLIIVVKIGYIIIIFIGYIYSIIFIGYVIIYFNLINYL